MMMKKWILMGMVVLCCLSAWAEVTITNLVVAQREGTKLVDISYDVSCDTTNEVWVTLSVSNGTEAIGVFNVIGDDLVLVGTNKTMIWDMAADWNGSVSSNMAFEVVVSSEPPPPAGMVQIPAGTNSGTDPDYGTYSLTVDAFYMDKYEVTKALWDEVAGWADDNGYDIAPGGGSGKAMNHPVQTVTWYECVKWCNARSQMNGRTPCYTVSGSVYKTGESSPDCNFDANGYRLPTNDEWEYAARGGLSGKRFPWGDTITHSLANYYSSTSYSYDTSTTHGYHPGYDDGGYPYTSPSGTFEANGYGLYDMVGNVWEWCNTASGSYRILRGGSWHFHAYHARCGYVSSDYPNRSSNSYDRYGFRSVCR